MPNAYSRTFLLNGRPRTITGADDAEQLLYPLREQLDQRGPKFGCGVAQCGACTVVVDGAAVRSCVTPVRGVAEGCAIDTLDGLGGAHPLQTAFVERQAAQCAFCVNGMVMGAKSWLDARVAAGDRSVPSREEVATYLSGRLPEQLLNYLCRCGAHTRILDAVVDAAAEMVR
ncbi:MAG: (2Fe-2S)-binding protein [Frankiales bacterium]|nr:(2Fe-2S)-binding protein [Frankiales bacterium]